MNSHDSFEAIDSSIVDAARRMLAGDLDVIDGSHQIARLSRSAREPDDEIYLVFRGIESESDDLPRGHERASWSSEGLAVKDRERADYLEKVRRVALDGCLALLQRNTPPN